MKDIDTLFGKAIGEIERMLNTKTVVGDPITVEGNTLIPLVSVGFGFGVGAGEGNDPKKGVGSGGGTWMSTRVGSSSPAMSGSA